MGKKALVSQEQIESAVLTLRGERVLMDADLAALYGVTTGALNQAVARNRARFSRDFMFQLTKEELQNWRSQIVMSNPDARMSVRRRPYAFTEQGVAMLSSVLRSQRAVQVNVEIMRAFVRLRRVLTMNADLAHKIAELESRLGEHDQQFVEVIRAIRLLMEPATNPPRRRIGFHTGGESSKVDSPRDAKVSRGRRK